MQQSSCLIIAGEKSGEDHCLSFFAKLKSLRPDIDFFGVGGDLLEKQGMSLMYHLSDFSSWGIAEVVGKIPFYLRAKNIIIEEVKKRNCQTAILIDFQDFNLMLARKLKKMGVDVLYYVAPQAWVWRAGRAQVLEQNIHTLFTILPFEKKWFEDRGVSCVKSIVHPLLTTHQNDLENIPHKPFRDLKNRKIRVLLLPGSRDFEVEHLLPVFINAIKALKEDLSIEIGIVQSSSVDSIFYNGWEGEIDKVYQSEDMADALCYSDFAIASSGTATLMTGLFEVPTIVCYKVAKLTEMFIRCCVRYKGYASLTNIIHQQEIFPEHLQGEAKSANIVNSLKNWVNNENLYNETKHQLKDTKAKLSGDSFDVAEYISGVLGESHE